MLRVMLFSAQDKPLGDLAPDEVRGLVRTDELNGEHYLDITTTRTLEQGMRVVYRDAQGLWREYVVYGLDQAHAEGAPVGTYRCIWSLQHDLEGVTCTAMPGTQAPATAAQALAALLSNTSRWAAGTVTQGTTGGASMWRMSAWEALGVLVDVWGGEVGATIEVGAQGVTAREIDLHEHAGRQTATRRFEYSVDLAGISRRVADGPRFCRVVPLGAAEQTEGGGYGRKITVESVNAGREYVEDPDMALLYRLPNGSGGWEYPTRYVENPDAETPQQLLEWAQANIKSWTIPAVEYSADVVQLSAAGMDATGIAEGDAVQVVDRSFYPSELSMVAGLTWQDLIAATWQAYRYETWEQAAQAVTKRYGKGLRLEGRVHSLTVDELDPSNTKVRIGSIASALPSVLSTVKKSADRALALSQGTANYMTTAEWVADTISRINAEANATGGYAYLVEGEGILTYDVAVSDPAVGAEASQVVQIKGGNLRIANSRTSGGDWDWRTVLVSGHIAADLVTAAHITAGSIGSASGYVYIDLDAGVIRMGDESDVWSEWTSSSFDVNYSARGPFFDVSWDSASSTPSMTFGNRASGSAVGGYSIGLGLDVEASGDYSLALGRETAAAGNYSHAEGAYSTASGNYSHAEGNRTTAGGPFSHAEGANTEASGDYSHAEGSATNASGMYSHAEGIGSVATGPSSHAEGTDTTASGEFAAHAEGRSTTASGSYSHAGGYGSTAAMRGSFAHGYYVNADSQNYQAVFGTYNAAASSGSPEIFTVGNGTSGARSTAFKVLYDGSAAIQKGLALGEPLPVASGGTGNSSVSTETTVYDVITAASNVIVSSCSRNIWGKMVMLSVTFKPMGALALNTSLTVGTIASGYRPKVQAFGGNQEQGIVAHIATGGALVVKPLGIALSSGSSYTVTFTYMLP